MQQMSCSTNDHKHTGFVSTSMQMSLSDCHCVLDMILYKLKAALWEAHNFDIKTR